MNKYQEAFESLTDWFHAYTDDYGVRVLERHITDDYRESKKLLESWLKKQYR